MFSLAQTLSFCMRRREFNNYFLLRTHKRLLHLTWTRRSLSWWIHYNIYIFFFYESHEDLCVNPNTMRNWKAKQQLDGHGQRLLTRRHTRTRTHTHIHTLRERKGDRGKTGRGKGRKPSHRVMKNWRKSVQSALHRRHRTLIKWSLFACFYVSCGAGKHATF